MSNEATRSTETEWEETDLGEVRADYAAHKQEAAERKARGAVVRIEKEGKSIWRFLPRIKGKKLFGIVWVHAVNAEKMREVIALLNTLDPRGQEAFCLAMGIDKIAPVPKPNKGFKTYVCQSKQADGPCATCELSKFLTRLGRSGDDEADEMGRELRSRQEYFANAVRMDVEADMKRGPRVLKMSQSVYEDLNEVLDHPQTAIDFTHPDTGCDVIITRKGMSREDTEYSAALARQSSKIQDRAWLGKLNDLTKVVDSVPDSFILSVLTGERVAPPEEAEAVGSDRQLPAAQAQAAPVPAAQVEAVKVDASDVVAPRTRSARAPARAR